MAIKLNRLNRKDYYQAIYKSIQDNRRDDFRELFLKLHEKDQVAVFHKLYPEKKYKIVDLLQASEFAELFEHLDYKGRRQAIEDLPADRQAIEAILEHDFQTAGDIMTTEVLTVYAHDSADQVITQIRQSASTVETIYYVYVVDEARHLLGVLSLRELLRSAGDCPVQDIMNSQLVQADIGMDQEEVARIIKEYDLLALPVVDSQGKLVGIVTVDDVMDVMDLETTEDFHRFAGISGSADNETDKEGILETVKNRLPWIIILIFLGLVSANLINMFESTLSRVVVLAVFMPIIMDSAGNVGTQSLAVSVRRLTLGDTSESFWSLIWKELVAGIIIGLAAGLTICGVAYFLFGNLVLSFIIGISLAVTLSVSTVIGYLVPTLFSKIHIDPAVASGPFITTLTDATGLLIYFSLATYLMHLL
ncbi:magnesium transporter [Aerococcus sp. UMB8608]|uniref:magnesium transporter n=1 Tax=Aerococcus sp. UMB8608 TaxID=3046347 RepID=UPI002549DCCC|nr:magnesium transporter [Aerococcus sp. UMB8608]MDK6679120.1 magnesium transporter [Aerococcus sp. UMB8608]